MNQISQFLRVSATGTTKHVPSGALQRCHLPAATASAGGRAPRASFARLFSREVTQVDQDAENAAILASMEKLNAEANLINNKGHISYIPDMNHTLPEDVTEVTTLDHMPAQQKGRTVVIHAEVQHAMTSGVEGTRGWKLYFKNQQRWNNPLTGWTSSADPMTSVKMAFDTKQQAIDFATKKGLNYEVRERARRNRSFGTNYYAHNFLPASTEATLEREGVSNTWFDNPKDNRSNYFRPLEFHGAKPCRTHGLDQQAPIAACVGGVNPNSKKEASKKKV
jgi:NADH dehydrogenase (ubiquinone) Fe-S protein 4